MEYMPFFPNSGMVPTSGDVATCNLDFRLLLRYMILLDTEDREAIGREDRSFVVNDDADTTRNINNVRVQTGNAPDFRPLPR
jgi:hypothetical protein